ncbi:alkaline phosphatase D family protein [Mycobacteroides immunogenum]|uniref:Alkaline phosphatase n=1 Tax=Mycobacteroides immunogenum TaxID=83262 RepID=A0A7V8LMX0_9MYCO|nr:alkaline phosphatase D family protein [Mycobacteroides immunogenum]AMT72407.1 alkaline phosphatase [Mycobacteroides immunogenum]ANO05556.1 alkaline phosphatase [Mycobacteroides immunogenum]KIU41533.1 alkaline phosphatase [Mycobacteroides immunogenum]KPG06546.1 alkaline phosphatase [Mycobacteroides immunogenum]KPG08335.1 alkaline phosphatase [Mycobacteroides immunogenum]
MTAIPRRTVLRTALFGLAAAPVAACGPALVTTRPKLTHGVASGFPRTDGAVIWARSDRPATMIVETAATESFSDVRRFKGPILTPDTDGTGRLRLTGLPADAEVHYRVTLDSDGSLSEPLTGVFRTAPAAARNVRLIWSGDVAGQGFGINPDLGGMRVFRTMADRNPDFFLHSGDTVYADVPIPQTLTLPDGRIWRNEVSEAKSAVAQTLDQYRGQHAYNLTDANYRYFNARVPQLVQWDDHEVLNNWYPGEVLDNDKYTEKRVDVLAQRGHRAFHEWQPLEPLEAVDGRVYQRVSYGPLLDVFILDMRSYKDPNSPNRQQHGTILGARQTEWLIDAMAASTAVWKVVANDLPLALVVPDGKTDFEAVANADNGPPLGRETELAHILSQLKARKVRNVVWLTADVHYTAAHEYSPARAAFTDFDPFWEFVSGPLNAGAGKESPLDKTFGPQADFVHAAPPDKQSPLDGYQHFGQIDIDGGSGDLTVTLCDAAGAALYTRTLARV